MRLLTFASVALAATVVAGPASAVVTTFASFSPIGNTANVSWVGSANNAANNFGKNGTFYSTATSTATVAGSRNVTFSFLQSALAPYVTNVTAKFTLNGSVTNTPAQTFAGFILQPNVSGSFSFMSTSAITIGSVTLPVGSNLLSGTFGNNSVFGTRNGSAGSFSGSTPSSSISFTSDFLTFIPGSNYDMSLSLTSIIPGLNALPTNAAPTRALRSFRAVSGGTFSSDPAPVPIVPEPAVWAQLFAGFALVGFAARRRNVAVAA